MKKFYTLLALCLFGLVSMSAKDYYTLEGISSSEYPSVDKIETGVSYFIGNARTNSRSFLCPTGATTALSSACLYQFEEAGTDKHGTTTYIIKNVETGQYLSDPSTYTASRSRAQEFTILPGEVFHAEATDGGAPYHVDWANVDYDPRNATSDYDTNGNFILADEFIDGSKTCWVFCLANSESGTGEEGESEPSATYLSTYGGASIMGYRDTNCWAIYVPAKITGEAAMDAAFQDILGGVEFDPDNYRVGSGPGEYSQEAVDAMIAAWEVFSELYNYGGDDAACDAAIAQLQAAADALAASMGTLNDGQYYRFWNWRDNGSFAGCVYEGNNQVKWTANYTAPDVLDIEGTHYIWKLVKIDGKNYFQNYYTGRYMSDMDGFSQAFPSTVEPTTSFTIEPADAAGTFNIRGDERSASWGMHTQVNGYVVVYWNAGTSENNQGSLWRVETIDPAQIEALEAELEQAHKNQELSNLLGDATLTYDKGFAYDQYLTSLSQVSFNATETSEGSEEAICDGILNNYYHSRWSSDGDLGQPHWFQVECEEPVQEFALDVYRRQLTGNANGRVVRWFVAGTNDASLASAEEYVSGDMAATFENYKNTWDTWQIVNGEYNNDVNYNGVNYTDAMATFDVNLGKACKYIRCMAVLRYSDKVVRDTISVDPLEVVEGEISYGDAPKNNVYMHFGEVVMRSQKINESISLINAVPADVRKALEDAMAKAKEELAAEAATDATIAELQKAYDDFLENFPEPQVLRDLLEDAQGWVDEAPIGDEVGYFPDGATAELEAAIEKVGATVKDVMSMEEINAGKKALNDAIDALQGKLIYPEEGIYMIQSTTEGAAADNYVGNLWSGETQLIWGGNGEELEATSHPGYFWKLTKNTDGTYSLCNYGTGNYLQAQPEETSPVGAAAEKSSFKLRSARLGGSFNLVFGENNFMNADPNTGRIVTWGSAMGADNSSFAFVEASEEWSGDYGFYYEAGKPQIITLPFDIVNDSSEPLYKLVGTYEGAFQFDYYEDDAVIPAGTPVLYYSEDDSYSVDMFGTVAGELDKLTYTTEAKSQEGMIGVLAGIEKAPLGVGIFWGKKIVAAEDGDQIEPNTGFLLRGEDCGREGELAIYYDSTVGTLTGIENTVAVKKSNNRGTFNLQGQKVSGKLPAGLYIVGGHKVVVK